MYEYNTSIWHGDAFNFQVTSHQGPDELKGALEGCDVVAIPAGVPRKPGRIFSFYKCWCHWRTVQMYQNVYFLGMTRDDLFNTNASIVQNLAEACAK